MYEIRKDGDVLALTEQPNYIRLHAEGFYALCGEAEAQGIAVNGTAYNLYGRVPMDGCETVQLAELDEEDNTLDMLADHEYRLCMMELGAV